MVFCQKSKVKALQLYANNSKTKKNSQIKMKVNGLIAGMTLEELRDDYRDRIFNQYLPFWNNGGIDSQFGGFMCELNDDGSIVNEEKYIWYQGRGIWVYSCLYINFGRNEVYLDIAKKSRDFLLKNMYLGNGKWQESVNRMGKQIKSTVAQGSDKDIYGALFSAAGLIELYKAEGNKKDLDIAITSIRASVDAYEHPEYKGVSLHNVNVCGLRTLGHSFVLIWVLTNLLSIHHDMHLEQLQDEHVNHIINHFWNSNYGIMNEVLYHDYTRISGYESVMYTGHSLETLWMVLNEAIRKNDQKIIEICKTRILHLLEMNWDYVFGGLCTENYYVFGGKGKCAGSTYDLKTMWAQCEMLLATMMIYEYSGETWAKVWYERARSYCIKYMANTDNGVWRQATDRLGKDKKRTGISPYRKDNFHQIRYLMMNLLAIERLIKYNKMSL